MNLKRLSHEIDSILKELSHEIETNLKRLSHEIESILNEYAYHDKLNVTIVYELLLAKYTITHYSD